MKAIVSAEQQAHTGGNARTDFLTSGQFLNPGDQLISPNGLFTLTFQTNGQLVMKDWTGASYWSGGSAFSNPKQAIYQSDGNFVTYNTSNKPQWASGPINYGPGFITLQNNGNLVIYADNTNSAVWQSGTVRNVPTMTRQVLYAGDYMDPGDVLVSSNKDFMFTVAENGLMQLINFNKQVVWYKGTPNTLARLIMQEDGNLVLYQIVMDSNGNGVGTLGNVLWAMNNENGNKFFAGSYCVMQDDGNLVVYRTPGFQNPVWASGTNVAVPSGTTPLNVATTPACGAVLDGGQSAASICGGVFAGISGCGGVLSGVGVCGVVYSGGSFCGAVANAIGLCAADVSTFGVCGVVAAAAGAAVVSIVGVGSCGAVAAIAGVCGAVAAAAGASAIGASGTAACGAVACGAAACGADASGAGACLEASGAGACGVNATGAQGTGVCGAQVGFCAAVLCVAIPIGGNW